jgi:hypothetical protein
MFRGLETIILLIVVGIFVFEQSAGGTLLQLYYVLLPFL